MQSCRPTLKSCNVSQTTHTDAVTMPFQMTLSDLLVYSPISSIFKCNFSYCAISTESDIERRAVLLRQ